MLSRAVEKSRKAIDSWLIACLFCLANSYNLFYSVLCGSLFAIHASCDSTRLLQVFDEAYRKEFPAVTRWFLTVANQPTVKSVHDSVSKLCKTPVKFTRASFLPSRSPFERWSCTACLYLLLHSDIHTFQRNVQSSGQAQRFRTEHKVWVNEITQLNTFT